MANTIDEFKNRFKDGFARPNRYEVLIVPPQVLALTLPVPMKDLAIACEAVEMPGILLATQEDKQFGPVRKVPYLNVFNDLALVFICSNDMRERDFFDFWQASMLERGDPQIPNPADPAHPLRPQFKLEYYDRYVTSIKITLLDEKNEKTKSVTCYECYPIEVITQPLSYNNVNDYLKLEVRLAYRYWL
jgi:hypothetical protein